MKEQLHSATEVLAVPGVEGSIGAREFFGPSTSLTCLHRLHAEFRAALSSDANIESIRATYYERPMQFIASAGQKESIDNYGEMSMYRHPGKAIVFNCPTTAQGEWWPVAKVESE